MLRYAHTASPDSFSLLAKRAARLLASLGCLAVLAGCASSTAQKSAAFVSDTDETRAEWLAASDDPIGMLVSRSSLKRERSSGQGLKASFGGDALLAEAMNQLGVRYRFGGTSPDSGFDCSGLILYSAERSLGLKLPRNAAEMARQSQVIDRSELRPGDLVFFNTLGRRYSHVGIYIGEDSFIHSPSSGGVVRIEKMTVAYWNKRYNGARRVVKDNRLASAQARD